MYGKTLGSVCTCLAWLACAACTSDPGSTQIRVHNASGVDFASVTADGSDFGPLPAGATSGYHLHDPSSEFGALRIVIGGAIPVSFTPAGHSGATSLGTGYFTYHVTVTVSGSGYRLGVVASTD